MSFPKPLKVILPPTFSVLEIDLKNLESEMDKLNSPWTPGRAPDWKE
jgi:hypothetical protein